MADQKDQGGQKRALIIGISDYTSLQKLDFCKNDAREVYKVLTKQRYNIPDKNRLVGEAKGEKLKDAIYDFFGNRNIHPDDTLVFYYSGHGVLDGYGDTYLASSDISSDEPGRRGFSFDELTKLVQRSISTRIVVILDSCYSGSAKLSKGGEEDAKVGRTVIDEKSRKLHGHGKYILSASQAMQDAFSLKTQEHSLFTYYLLKGLDGDKRAVDNEGNITPQSLAKYVYREIMSLPAHERPKQTPVMKTEESGDVILASYPDLISNTKDDIIPLTSLSEIPSVLPVRKGVWKYLPSGHKGHMIFVSILAAAAFITGYAIIFGFSNIAFNSSEHNTGFIDGGVVARLDLQNGNPFNPACDPTGAFASSNGQHSTTFCSGWTRGYMESWNLGPSTHTAILGASNEQRYAAGINDGGQTALSDLGNGSSFNPACDPTRRYSSDALHTTTYCNGWTKGYISAWNIHYRSSKH